MPIYNKFMLGTAGVAGTGVFSHPVSMSALHVMSVAFLMAAGSVLKHYVIDVKTRDAARQALLQEGADAATAAAAVPAAQSWVFGPGLGPKIRALAIPAVSFALSMALSNLGVHTVPANVHILFRASETGWVVLLSWALLNLKPTRQAGTAVAGLTLGVVLVALDYGDGGTGSAGDSGRYGLGLLFNLAAALVAAVQFVSLRSAVVQLKNADPTIGVGELTTIKLLVAGILMVPSGLLTEPSALADLLNASGSVWAFLSAGIALTGGYQLAVVGLSAFTMALTTAVLHQARIPGQIILSVVLLGEAFSSPLQIFGAVLTFVCSSYYGWLRHTRLANRISGASAALQENPPAEGRYNTYTPP